MRAHSYMLLRLWFTTIRYWGHTTTHYIICRTKQRHVFHKKNQSNKRFLFLRWAAAQTPSVNGLWGINHSMTALHELLRGKIPHTIVLSAKPHAYCQLDHMQLLRLNYVCRYKYGYICMLMYYDMIYSHLTPPLLKEGKSTKFSSEEVWQGQKVINLAAIYGCEFCTQKGTLEMFFSCTCT